MAAASPSLFRQVGLFAGFARALPGYLREPIDPGSVHRRIEDDLGRRGENLARVIVTGILWAPRSPYRALFDHVGLKPEDVSDLIRRCGVEPALERLYDAGVYVSLDEFKGRKPIVRGSLRIDVTSRDFDNPLATTHLAAQSGGSRSAGTRITIDLAHNDRSALYDFLMFETLDALERPYVIWQPTLPYGAGVNALLRYAKLGRTPARWFSQSPPPGLGKGWQHGLVTRYLVAAARRHGRPLPAPEHVPLAQAERVAECLAQYKTKGTPALVNTNASSGTRVCLAAREHGLDIAGTVFRLGGEPLTEARARIVAASGSRAFTVYGMGEIGRIGLPCAHGEATDEVHVLTDKLGVIRRTRNADAGRPPVAVNVYSTLVSSTPKLMLNVESDDYGVLGARSCGCALDQLGYGLHLHTIRSHEKLTSEGMNFLGNDLIRLLEEVLPARFGGGPTDFQLVEDEDEDGLPDVQLLVSPRLGPLEAGAVAGCVIGFLNDLPGAGGAYGERWREGRTLRVVRDEPHATSASKVMALHTTRKKVEREVGAAAVSA